uniref:Uncharacterized protein n=2 Tax=viral metagenome TaxID=1070528 RepID=A0A6M3K984_9ZZZZ
MIDYSEETKIDDIVDSLYERIQEETEKILKQQADILGCEVSDFGKTVYPDDEFALATYHYRGSPVLGVRVGENRMGIEFDIPKLESVQKLNTKGETQDVQ